MTRRGMPHQPFDEDIAAYCFGDLPESRRSAFELHLLTCDICFPEVERLMAGVHALRADVDASSGALQRSEVVGLLGISADLQERLAGHLWFVAAVTAVYAVVSAEAVLTELSYFMGRYAGLAWWAVPTTLVCVGAAMLGALVVAVRRTRADRSDALVLSCGILVSVVAVMLLGAQVTLPHEPSIQSTLVPRTIASANFRNFLLYGLPLALLFVLVPFHFVVTIQRELARGRHENVLRFFSKDPLAIAPRGAIYVPPQVLGGLLVVAAIYLVVANQYLLDNLVSGPHSELFASLIYLRIGLGLSLAGGSFAWYIRMLNEAKREALAMRSPIEKPTS